MKAMRIAAYTLWYFGVTALGVAVAHAQVHEEFHQSYTLAPGGKVAVRNVNGTVRVVAWDRNEVRVDAVKSADTQQELTEVQIRVDARPDLVDIHTDYPRNWGGQNRNNHTNVDYNISVPRQAVLDAIKTVNGTVDIEGVAGDVRAASVNGKVIARGLQGEVDLSTVNGTVDAVVDRPGKPISMKSVNGELDLALPSTAGARLTAKTMNGGINSDFGSPVETSRFVPGKKLETMVGAGGPEIQLSTVNGRINVRRR